MCLQKGLASKVKGWEEKTQSRPAEEHEKRSRGNEPDPPRSNPSDFAMHSSLTGSPLDVPRLCAVGAPAMSQNRGPWNEQAFQNPPARSNTDRWVTLTGGFYCRVHGGFRSRLFHPVHSSTPIRPEDLEPWRTTVLWHGPNMERLVHHDMWGLGSAPIPGVQGQWIGYTFVRVAEGNQYGQSSSGRPRIHPEILTWTPAEERPRDVQAGISSAHQRRGGSLSGRVQGGYQPAENNGRGLPSGDAGAVRGRPGPEARGRVAMESMGTSRFGGQAGAGTAGGPMTIGAGPMGVIPTGAPSDDAGGVNPLLASLPNFNGNRRRGILVGLRPRARDAQPFQVKDFFPAIGVGSPNRGWLV